MTTLPLGPINNDVPFMLFKIIETKPHVLVYRPSEPDSFYPRYLFVDTPSPVGHETLVNTSGPVGHEVSINATGCTGPTGQNLENINVAVFTTTGRPNNLQFLDTANGGYLAYTEFNTLSHIQTLNDVGIGINVSANFSMQQNEFATWNPPTVLLSGVKYNLRGVTGSELTQDFVAVIGPTGLVGCPEQETTTGDIIPIPITWYINCPGQGSDNTVINQPTNVIETWFCLQDATLPVCSGIGKLPTSAWSNANDCVTAQSYRYCPPGSNCGSQNCNGPCQLTYDDCKSENNNFVCVLNPERYFEDGGWWRSPYFIGFVLGFIVIILVLVIIIIYLVRRREKEEN